jgi:hypothetical protein
MEKDKGNYRTQQQVGSWYRRDGSIGQEVESGEMIV